MAGDMSSSSDTVNHRRLPSRSLPSMSRSKPMTIRRGASRAPIRSSTRFERAICPSPVPVAPNEGIPINFHRNTPRARPRGARRGQDNPLRVNRANQVDNRVRIIQTSVRHTPWQAGGESPQRSDTSSTASTRSAEMTGPPGPDRPPVLDGG